jgi:hypothetical protein
MTLVIDSTEESFRQIFDNNIWKTTRLEISGYFHILESTGVLNLKELYINYGDNWIDLEPITHHSCLRSLSIYGNTPLPNLKVLCEYLKFRNLRELDIEVNNYSARKILSGICENTSITTLKLRGKPIPSILQQIKIPNLLAKTNLVSLKICESILSEICKQHFNAFAYNTTLKHLTLIGRSSIPDNIFHNLSVISCVCEDLPDVFCEFYDNWTEYNRSLKWKEQHALIIDIYLALQSRHNLLPPYVFLEIFDWLIDSDTGILGYNPFVSHVQKIQLITNLYRSIFQIENRLTSAESTD